MDFLQVLTVCWSSDPLCARAEADDFSQVWVSFVERIGAEMFVVVRRTFVALQTVEIDVCKQIGLNVQVNGLRRFVGSVQSALSPMRRI